MGLIKGKEHLVYSWMISWSIRLYKLRCSFPLTTKPSGWLTYTSSGKSLFKNAILNSSWKMSQFLWALMAMKTLTVSICATGEKTSVKSIPSYCANPLATILAFFLSSNLSGFILVWFFWMDSISSPIVAIHSMCFNASLNKFGSVVVSAKE